MLSKPSREDDLHEGSVFFLGAMESLRHGITHYLLGGLEDLAPAILELHRAMELLFKAKLEILDIDCKRERGESYVGTLVKALEGNDVKVRRGWRSLNRWRNKAKHMGDKPSEDVFDTLVRRNAFPLLRDFLTRELQCDLEDVLPSDYSQVLKGEEKWDVSARVFAMAAVEYLIRDLAEAVRMAKRGLEEAVWGLAEENREALENAALERAEEGDYIPPLEKWRFGDVLEAFLGPLLGDGTEMDDWVPYSSFIFEEDVERIKESIIPRHFRESPPSYLAYRFVTTACDWIFRFADAPQLTLRVDLTEDIRVKWPSILHNLKEEQPYLQAMLAKIDPESIEVRGNTLWIRGYKTEEQREELEKSSHKQAILRAIQSRCGIRDDLKIHIGHPLYEVLGPPHYLWPGVMEELRARVRRLKTGEKGPRERMKDEWDEW